MPRSFFVSYSRHQAEWVWWRLVPVLKAGGAEVLIDLERFEAGRAVYRQMDEAQDCAEVHLLVLSTDYLASSPCRHEMERAIGRDPEFERGVTVPLVRGDCELPPEIRRPDPLHVDLRDDRRPEPWDLLLRRCGLDLGADAPGWLAARDAARCHLDRGESVNLVVTGRARWRPLLDSLREDPSLRLGVVRLDSTEAMERPSLVGEILRQCGCPHAGPVPEKNLDLVLLGSTLNSLPRAPRLALTSFDHVRHRMDDYGVDLFVALRDLMMEKRKLVLLIVSRSPFATLLPRDHPLSAIDLKTVELRGRP